MISHLKNINIYACSSGITLSFVLRGESFSVKSISYKIAVDDYSYIVFIDDTGSSRSHTFLSTEINKTISSSSVIRAAIGIEDIDGNITYSRSSQNSVDITGGPIISNLSAVQRTDGSGLVDIWYDYESNKEISSATVTLLLYKGSYLLPTASAAGDFGFGVMTGQNRHIVWNPAIDALGMEGSDFQAEMVLVDEDGLVATGDRVTGTFVVDATSPTTPLVVFKKKNEADRYGVQTTDDLKNRTIEI